MSFEIAALPFRQTGKFSSLFCAYTENQPALREFHSGFPSGETISERISAKKDNFSPAGRSLLCRALEEQAAGHLHPAQQHNLEKLKESQCFSVSCGHQLSIAGGPQYMAFKILSTIRLAKDLKADFPQYDFVPVFWLASEDHDLEEILGFRFFGNSYRMDISGSGAVGRMPCGESRRMLEEIRDFPLPMARAYESGNLSEATRTWLNHFFGHHGLLILEPDRRELKQAFLPVMLRELSSPENHDLIREQSRKLETMGYEAQLHPRELNLFYLNDKKRVRLVRNDNGISTLDGEEHWSMEDALAHFSAHPEELSPNACLRPLYSQLLLPDVAFIGGPAEIAYWLQLKPVFDACKVSFPLLIPRFSALILPENRRSRLEKLGLQPEELFGEVSHLRKKLALGDEEIPLPSLREAFSATLAFAARQDASLVPALEAEISRMEDMAAGMAKRIRKAAERKAETGVQQLENILEYCFPGGSLLERSESWLSMEVQRPGSLDEIYRSIRPLDFRFFILSTGKA